MGLVLLILIILIILFFGFSGLIDLFPSDEPSTPAAPENNADSSSVTASGNIKKLVYDVTVRLTFPLDGGAVTGSFSGSCNGSVSGTYAGGDAGAISGTGSGICNPVPLQLSEKFNFPVSGSFNGIVNHINKKVPITVSGTAKDKTGSVQMVLGY